MVDAIRKTNVMETLMRNLKGGEIRLKSRPVGMPTEDNFDYAEGPVAEPKDGEVLVRNVWMSVDPYMRGRMVDRESYVPPFQIGQALQGHAVGQVIAAGKGAAFAEGDYIGHMLGWREYAVVGPAAMPMKVDPKLAPVQSFLGALGMPGMTAYAGLFRVGAFKDGETVFVSAASGAVGAVVCQLARMSSARPGRMRNANGSSKRPGSTRRSITRKRRILMRRSALRSRGASMSISRTSAASISRRRSTT